MPAHYAVINALGRQLALTNMTATELSSASGIHPRTITEYLAGRVAIPDRHLVQLADALDCDPEDIDTIS